MLKILCRQSNQIGDVKKKYTFGIHIIHADGAGFASLLFGGGIATIDCRNTMHADGLIFLLCFFGATTEYCNIMHADGAGTKSSLAYLYWKETGDLSVWKGIAQV